MSNRELERSWCVVCDATVYKKNNIKKNEYIKKKKKQLGRLVKDFGLVGNILI